MCRLFGYRGTPDARFLDELVHAPNALGRQSLEHQDGWGVARYDGERPLVERGLLPAHDDAKYVEAVTRLAGPTVVAHVRKASVGPRVMPNTHPFTHGRWTFAHNGTVPLFATVRRELEDLCDKAPRARIAGDTDSEVLFALFQTFLAKQPAEDLDAAIASIDATVAVVNDACEARGAEASLNLLVTDGRVMAACRQRRSLYFTAEGPPRDPGAAVPLFPRVDRFIVASEPFGPGHVWREVPEGELVGVDERLRLVRRRLHGAHLDPHALPAVPVPA